ncbi:MAG TPA: cell division protein ZapA [Methanosarcina sp.]|nr:cell division protein ZapA [Methanosarcina sp.]
MNELSISITIADRPYKLVIEKEHEELFRKAAKLIEKRMKDYSGSYAYKDKQDLLAMVALEYSTSYLRGEQVISERDIVLEKKLHEIDAVLDEFLH